MGKITDLIKHQNSIFDHLKNESKKENKPKLYIKSYRDLAYLIGPNAKNKYRLSQNQLRFQKTARLTIATIAASFAIGGSYTAYSHLNNNASKQNQTFFEKDSLLLDAENEILNCIFGINLEYYTNPHIEYIFNEDDGNHILLVVTGDSDNKDIVFSYSQSLSFDGVRNAQEVSNLLDNMLDIYYSDTYSQKDLQDLNNSIENMENKKFKLEGNRIVAIDERSSDFER